MRSRQLPLCEQGTEALTMQSSINVAQSVPAKRRRNLWTSPFTIWAAVVFVLWWCWLSYHLRGGSAGQVEAPSPTDVAKTLVIYVFESSHTLAEENLLFFLAQITQGETASDVFYVFLIAVGGMYVQPDFNSLPSLPSNSMVYETALHCNELGLAGWLLKSNKIDRRQYSQFLFLSSGVRGPFLPAYARHSMHWTRAFVQKLDDNVKLVGSTISCGVSSQPDLSNYKQPHVQKHVVAMDSQGLELIFRKGCFECHSNNHDDLRFGELAMSEAILERGYQIQSLMVRYEEVDWHDEDSWGCNGGVDPVMWSADGIQLNPMEVMFVPVTDMQMMTNSESARHAVVYSEWLSSGPSRRYAHVKPNRYVDQIYEAVHQEREKCFDTGFYFEMSPDVAKAGGRDPQFGVTHFLEHGIDEGRWFRLNCAPLTQTI